jgi:DNA-binding transcriptional regulator YdaS (Cro superfamily)
MSGIEKAVAKAGSRRAFADSLCPPVSVQAICQWVRRGWVPPGRAIEIERLYGVDRAYLVKPTLVELVGEPVSNAS